MIQERLSALRNEMRAAGVDAVVIPTADYHASEYLGEYFKTRKYMTGFTGSAGTLVVTPEWAGLWTDGRYFIQAAAQLEGTGIELMRMGMEGVPDVAQKLYDVMCEGSTLGLDGRCVSLAFVRELEKKLAGKKIAIADSGDLVGKIWTDRPALSKAKAFLLGEHLCGRLSGDKLADVRTQMAKLGADVHIITTLDDIAWLFNIRGGDVEHTPVVLSYAVIEKDKAALFIDASKLDDAICDQMAADGVEILPYDDVYEYVRRYGKGTRVLIDPEKVNYAITVNLGENAAVIEARNPTQLMKACKNETEIENLRIAHIRDGVAFTKFMYWVKTNVGKMEMTEMSASDYLQKRREEQEGYIDLSFATICGYKEHAAMMHYSATPESDVQLLPEGLLLVDSGGQYFEGTTDITRTMALGPITQEEKKHFAAVLRGMLNLSAARFLHGCIGMNLDILARGPMWDMGIDYRCGTGHGVGYLLSVHEAPNGFRWKRVPERDDAAVLEEGMVTTNEPGIYCEGSHGVRTENEMVCHAGEKNEYGQFMEFETITCAPIDLDAIDKQYLTPVDVERLNRYHAWVFKTLSPYMTAEENEWLRTYTRAI